MTQPSGYFLELVNENEVKDGHAPSIIPISKPSIILGRGSQTVPVDVYISAKKDGKEIISRRHAEICYCPDGSIIIRDLGALNGLFVNDRRVSEHTLHVGEIVQFGGVAKVPIGTPLKVSDVCLKYACRQVKVEDRRTPASPLPIHGRSPEQLNKQTATTGPVTTTKPTDLYLASPPPAPTLTPPPVHPPSPPLLVHTHVHTPQPQPLPQHLTKGHDGPVLRFQDPRPHLLSQSSTAPVPIPTPSTLHSAHLHPLTSSVGNSVVVNSNNCIVPVPVVDVNSTGKQVHAPLREPILGEVAALSLQSSFMDTAHAKERSSVEDETVQGRLIAELRQQLASVTEQLNRTKNGPIACWENSASRSRRHEGGMVKRKLDSDADADSRSPSLSAGASSSESKRRRSRTVPTATQAITQASAAPSQRVVDESGDHSAGCEMSVDSSRLDGRISTDICVDSGRGLARVAIAAAAADVDVLKRHLNCSLCGLLLLDAVVAECSHGFCRLCLEAYVRSPKGAQGCPVCVGEDTRTTTAAATGTTTATTRVASSAPVHCRSMHLEALVCLVLQAAAPEDLQKFHARERSHREALSRLGLDPDAAARPWYSPGDLVVHSNGSRGGGGGGGGSRGGGATAVRPHPGQQSGREHTAPAPTPAPPCEYCGGEAHEEGTGCPHDNRDIEDEDAEAESDSDDEYRDKWKHSSEDDNNDDEEDDN